ncbi:MAG: hypothetical protein ABEJ26_08530 [Halosimplex sp.]
MQRRDALKAGLGAVALGGLSGCASGRSPGSNDGTEPPSTSTETTESDSTPAETATPENAASETPPSDAPATPPTSTGTPVPFPETCGPLPDIDGLPAPPSEPTADTAEAFVRDFERVYAVATTEEYGGVDSLRVRSVEAVGERYVVALSFDAVPATPTADAAGETPTPQPPDAYTHRAVYRLTGERMLREVRSHIDDSLLSRTCWTLESG